MMSVMQDAALDANGRWIKCVLNAKFIVFHMNFRKYLSFGTSKNFGTLENSWKKLKKAIKISLKKIVTKKFFFKKKFY